MTETVLALVQKKLERARMLFWQGLAVVPLLTLVSLPSGDKSLSLAEKENTTEDSGHSFPAAPLL